MSQIIVTLWPSTNTEEILESLYQKWVRILRFNFTHETPETAVSRLETIRKVEKKLNWKFELMIDIEWPSIRTGIIDQPRLYKTWEIFRMLVWDRKPVNNDIWCDYPGIINDVNVGSIIKIESWLFNARVLKKKSDCLLLEAQNEFTMTSKRHINLPDVHMNSPTITEKDKKDIEFALQEGFDWLAISFCRCAEDLKEAKLLTKNKIKLISKIENQEWLDNLSGIVEHSDMVMVARWDLWAELPIEKIPKVQIQIIQEAKKKWVDVIVATQLLSSMVTSPVPTRAEISDIFWAVVEWADYLMLSEETTIGFHPLKAVKTMNKAIIESKNHPKFDKIQKCIIIQ